MMTSKKSHRLIGALLFCAGLVACGGLQYESLMAAPKHDHSDEADYEGCMDRGVVAACESATMRLRFTDLAAALRTMDKGCSLGDWDACESLLEQVLKSSLFGTDENERFRASYELAVHLCKTGSLRMCKKERYHAGYLQYTANEKVMKEAKASASIKIINACESCRTGKSTAKVCGTPERVEKDCKGY